MVAKKPGKEEKKDVLVVGEMICVFRYGGTLRLPKWFLAQNFHSKPGI